MRLDPYFVFGNNQTGDEDNIDLWALLAIRDLDGVQDDIIFELTNSGLVNDPTTFTSTKQLGDDPIATENAQVFDANGDVIDPQDHDFVTVLGNQCAEDSGGPGVFGRLNYIDCNDPDQADQDRIDVLFDNNIGNNVAEFIGIIPEFNAILDDLIALGYDTISIDEHWFQQTNGFEDTFIVGALPIEPPTDIAEPMTLSLLGLGLFGVAASRRRTVL